MGRDPVASCRWAALAAEQDHPYAQWRRGGCLAGGIGGAPDRAEGLVWFLLALSNPDPRNFVSEKDRMVLRQAIREVSSFLTEEQVAEARRRAARWRAARESSAAGL